MQQDDKIGLCDTNMAGRQPDVRQPARCRLAALQDDMLDVFNLHLRHGQLMIADDRNPVMLGKRLDAVGEV